MTTMCAYVLGVFPSIYSISRRVGPTYIMPICIDVIECVDNFLEHTTRIVEHLSMHTYTYTCAWVGVV